MTDVNLEKQIKKYSMEGARRDDAGRYIRVDLDAFKSRLVPSEDRQQEEEQLWALLATRREES